MSILYNDHVSGTSGYVTENYRRRDKILCNRCPLNHEGRRGVMAEMLYELLARTRTCTVRRPANQGHIYIYIYEIRTRIHGMDATIQMMKTR